MSRPEHKQGRIALSDAVEVADISGPLETCHKSETLFSLTLIQVPMRPKLLACNTQYIFNKTECDTIISLPPALKTCCTWFYWRGH